MTTQSLIDKLWSFCDTLRDDGVSYGDYVEQLTYLLFLKMADEYSQKRHDIHLPQNLAWARYKRKKRPWVDTKLKKGRRTVTGATK